MPFTTLSNRRPKKMTLVKEGQFVSHRIKICHTTDPCDEKDKKSMELISCWFPHF